MRTSEKLALQYNVCEKTVRNSAKFADAAEKITKLLDPDFMQKVKGGESPAQYRVILAGKILEYDPEKAKRILYGKEPLSLKTAAQYARAAICELGRIRADDPGLDDALLMVLNWVNKVREANR